MLGNRPRPSTDGQTAGGKPGLFGFNKPAEPAPAAAAAPDGLIGDTTDQDFMVDVVEASRQQPVIVDFWAPWCGPCRQLTPALEKAVLAAKGAVKLIKVNIDENPRIAQQLRIQSIPTVYAFDNGQPVDGFQGALPDSQVKAFIERLSGPAAPSDVDHLLELAKESLSVNDIGGAAQAYAGVLQIEPDNVAAIAGLARCYLNGGDVERAREVADMAPADAKDLELASVRAALALSQVGDAETAPFEQRLAANPDDHEARFELAKALAGQGKFERAADELLAIIAKDLTWNDEAARKQLLTVFEAAGPGSDVAKAGRRKLSSILFA
jgi:putative thioredoxin